MEFVLGLLSALSLWVVTYIFGRKRKAQTERPNETKSVKEKIARDVDGESLESLVARKRDGENS